MAIALIFAVITASQLFGAILDDPDIRPIVQSTIELRFEHRHTEAEAVIDSLSREFPKDATPLFLRGSNLYDEMTHKENYREIPRMNSILDSAISYASLDLDEPWNLWIIGSSLGYKAMAEVERGSYLSAYNTSRSALVYLKSAMDFPKTRADAALGAGGYFYWVSASLGFLTYLPLVPDNRDEGVALLREAFQRSVYSRDAAAHALVYVFCKSGEFDSARVYRDHIARKYPSSMLPLWYNLSIAEAEKKLLDYFRAADALAIALDSLGVEQAVNAITVHHFSAVAAKDLNLWESAAHHCERAKSIADAASLQSKFKGELKECDSILRLARERLKR